MPYCCAVFTILAAIWSRSSALAGIPSSSKVRPVSYTHLDVYKRQEMHKVRIVQKLALPNVERRLKAITEAGNNTFLLKNKDVFLDMLTDSGVNAMSDRQQAAMLIADDSYAGSETFTRLENKIEEIFGMKLFLPTHQGRACENVIAPVSYTHLTGRDFKRR